jgi:hypothetical protein
MPDSRNTVKVEFDDELWDLVIAEAEQAGVDVSDYVRDAVIARIIVGPTDPRIFELFAAAVREVARDEPHAPTRRGAERSLSMLARLSAVRRQSEARALRAESAQIIRMTQRRRPASADTAPAAAPPTAPESAFRINPDWSEIRTASSRPAGDGGAPDVTWLRDEHVHAEDRERVHAAIAEATTRRAMLDLDYRVQLDGQVRRIHLRALPLLDAAGTITEWVAVANESPDEHH